MKLHELKITYRYSRTDRCGETISRGFGWICGDRKNLSGTTSGKHDVGRTQLMNFISLAKGNSFSTTGTHTQIKEIRVLNHPDALSPHRRYERAFDLVTRCGTTGVDDPICAVTALSR
jgi:hypothetical protein